MEQILAKINKLKNWQAALIILLVGFAVFSIGLKNQFEGDDYDQIVNNVPIHSITNIKLFFEGGTFYAGQGLKPLAGEYFRPLMTTIFSLVYTLFGAHPFYYHLLQLLICIASTTILYLFFRYSFKPPLALFLSLIFLVHPINSQNVFSIPNMQDALYFFFGISALYLLMRLRSVKSLILVALLLFLSLLSKETAVLFVAMSFLYLFWWDRKRVLPFLGITAIPAALWFVLRVHAIGLFANPYAGPIDRLDLGGRLMTAPEVALFYMSKFVFPLRLASHYFWVHPSYSAAHVLMPIIIDVLAIAIFIILGIIVHRKLSKAQYYTYLFFAFWASVGLIMLAQILPLDMTVSESWFYFPMVGVLGMFGIVSSTIPRSIKQSSTLIILAILLITILGFRTAIRGLDWRSQYELSSANIRVSPADYLSYNILAYNDLSNGDYEQAQQYTSSAVNIYPTYQGYINLANAFVNTGNYVGAENAYTDSFRYAGSATLPVAYEGRSDLTLLTGTYMSNKQFLVAALSKFPHDSVLWMNLAILEYRNNDVADAKISIMNASKYGTIPQAVYNDILQGQAFGINVAGQTVEVE